MKPKYLETYHLSELENYCKDKCINIVIKHHNENKEDIKYYRDLYSGYLYGKKVAFFLKKRKRMLTNIELYNHFKYQKNYAYKRGMIDALYDILNFISR